MTRRLLVALIAILSLLVAGALNAPAAEALPAPANGLCNPLGVRFCTHQTYRTAAYAAWRWSDAHTSRAARRPVPYPASTSWYLWKSYHVVYVINYRPRGAIGVSSAVWKYGITRQVPWTDRAQAGVRTCEDSGKAAPGSCRRDWIAVTHRSHGFYYARYMEASLIKQWQLRHGTRTRPCPPGQVTSCR